MLKMRENSRIPQLRRTINLNKKSTGTKHPGNLGNYEKTKSLNNSNRGRRTQAKGTENILTKILEEKFS